MRVFDYVWRLECRQLVPKREVGIADRLRRSRLRCVSFLRQEVDLISVVRGSSSRFLGKTADFQDVLLQRQRVLRLAAVARQADHDRRSE